MDQEKPWPSDPLSPYAPSELPEVPGDGRTWFAVLVALLPLGGAADGVVALLV